VPLVQEVKPKPLRDVPERLVVEAFVANRLVLVAEVPVPLEKVKFWRVVDEVPKY
jgi:hypothetical protein